MSLQAVPDRRGREEEDRCLSDARFDIRDEVEQAGARFVVIDRNFTLDKVESSHATPLVNRKWEAKLKQIEERASRYERKPLSSVYAPKLSKPEEPPSIWKLFYRQTEAFNFVKNCKEDVHVFALEIKVGDGQRMYLVTTYAQFWFYYKSRKNLLHCYEVIPENSVCKLYFDLEFNKLVNPRANGRKMIALLIEVTQP